MCIRIILRIDTADIQLITPNFIIGIIFSSVTRAVRMLNFRQCQCSGIDHVTAVYCNSETFLTAFLRCNHHCTTTTTRTVQCRCCCTFQYVDCFDIIGIDISKCQICRNTIQYQQRRLTTKGERRTFHKFSRVENGQTGNTTGQARCNIDTFYFFKLFATDFLSCITQSLL